MKFNILFLCSMLFLSETKEYKNQHEYYLNSMSQKEIVKVLMESEFWMKPELNDTVYDLMFAFFERPCLDASEGFTMMYRVYEMFENKPDEFRRFADRLKSLPDSIQRDIQNEILETLLSYEEIELYDQYLYSNAINGDSVKVYNERFRTKFPNSFLLFPENMKLFEYLIEK